MNILAVLQAIAPSIFKIIDDAVEDKDMANKLKNEVSMQMLNNQSSIADASAKVVMAEASGESWLQRNWRPMLMVWFSILIGGYWFGFVPINMPIEIVGKLFNLVTIGVGGYVGGRTVEKVATTIAPMLGKVTSKGA